MAGLRALSHLHVPCFALVCIGIGFISHVLQLLDFSLRCVLVALARGLKAPPRHRACVGLSLVPL